MKIKTLIAVAMLGVAPCVQAVNVMWGSGCLCRAESENGGWDSDTSLQSSTAKMSVFLVSEATYNEFNDASQKSMYSWSRSQTATLSATDTDTDSIIQVVLQNAETKMYYAILTATYTDSTYGEMYMAQRVAIFSDGAGDAEKTGIFGPGVVGSSGGVSDWQAANIPEPTSSLLLLLGVAGLSLRRKRA